MLTDATARAAAASGVATGGAGETWLLAAVFMLVLLAVLAAWRQALRRHKHDSALRNAQRLRLQVQGRPAHGEHQHACRIATEVESLCEQYWRALQLGNPVLLNDAEMSAVLDKFKTYGPNAAGK